MGFPASEAQNFSGGRQDSFAPAKLMEVCEGDRDFAKILAEAFLESGRESLHTLTASIEGSRRVEMLAAAHKLKGSALAIAAETLARLCGELEAACSVEESPQVRRLFERIQAEFDQVETALRPLVDA